MAIAATLSAIAIVVYLTLYDPASSPAPQCIFLRLTGWQCPGCGTQRAIHALMHGDVAAAWHFNAALFVAVPLIVVCFAARGRLRRIVDNPLFYVAVAAATVTWWIGRNVL